MSVSVVIPMYNSEKTIGNCLDGLLNQTMEQLQIICVDDGSEDSTCDICTEYMKKTGKIQLLRQNHAGPSRARNTGIECAKEEYIGFVDADDYVEKQMYQILYEQIKVNDADIGICNFSTIDSNGRKTIRNNKYAVPELFGNEEMIHYMFHREAYRSITGWVWNKIFRKERIARYNVRFNESLWSGEDICFLTDLLVSPLKISYCEQPLYEHICTEDSLSRRYWPRSYEDRILGYEYAITRFDKQNIPSNLIFWVKVFHCYHSSNYAEKALKNRDAEGFKNAQKYMRKYLKEYIRYNYNNLDRLARIRYLQEGNL